MERIKTYSLAVALLLGIGIGTQLPRLVSLRESWAQDRGKREESAPVLLNLKDQSRAFVAVAKRVGPSVVGISSKRELVRERDPFAWLFQPPGGQQSVGTGVLVSEDGYVLTNNHVVQGAGTLVVTLADNREFTGKIVGTDPESDLAVVRIEADALRPAALGDSDVVEVGEWALAIGNPFGLSSSVSAGIISAKGRSGVGVATYEGFIQTDAAINPGNSGGPLVNLDGEVIGITTAILTRSGGYQGIGFAIPINRAKHVMTSLIRDGKVQRGYLGVEMTDVGAHLVTYVNENYSYDLKSVEELCDLLGLKTPEGAFVVKLDETGPAAQAKLIPGDVIVNFAGAAVRNTQELSEAVAMAPVGSSVPVRVVRDGKPVDVQVKIAERKIRRR